MKLKTIFISLLLLASTFAFSQTEKGKWHLSGNSSIQVANSSATFPWYKYTNTTITINPSVGYFVANNFSLSLDLLFISKNEESTGYPNNNNKEITFSIIPTASYFIPTSSIIKPFAQVGIGYSTSKRYGRSSGLVLGAGIGIATFVSEYLSVDIGAQYLRSDLYGFTLNTFGGIVGFSVYF